MVTAATGIVTAGAAAEYVANSGRVEREDCPGKMLCPVTGDLICVDECPLNAAVAVSLPVPEASDCCGGNE